MSATSVGNPVTARAVTCQICADPVADRNPKRVFDCAVCRKCRNRFATRRQLAFIIDLILLGALMLGAATAIVDSRGPSSPRRTDATVELVIVLAIYIGLPLMFSAKDGFSGMSAGKWMCGVQVLDRSSRKPIGLLQSINRNICLLIPFVSPIMMLIVAFQLANGPRMGDRYARTMVIWRRFRMRPPFNPASTTCIACG